MLVDSYYFKSRISKTFYFTLFIGTAACLMGIYAALQFNSFLVKVLFTGFMIVIIAFLLAMWLKTGYRITPNKIIYYNGVIKGSLDIHMIRKLKLNETLWTGFKPALATKGIIILYNKYDEIYISPEREEAFVKILQEINPGIKIE